MSSVSVLLDPETKLQQWSALKSYSFDTHNLVADNATVTNITIDTLDVKDASFETITVSNSALISGVDYVTLNGLGLPNQVLSSDGAGHVQWLSNGNGNVVGPLVSVAGDIATYADATGQLLNDSGVNIANVLVNPLTGNVNAGDNEITNLKDIVCADQAVIAPPAVGNNKLYSNNADGRFYTVNGALVGGKIPLYGIDLDQTLLTTSNVFFNTLQTTNGIEDDGASFTLNDGVAAGSETIGFQIAGVPDKYIDCTGNVMHIRNNAFADILTMSDAKSAEFFGDVKVDGTLKTSNLMNQTMEFTGTVVAGQWFNSSGNPVNAGQVAQSPLTDEAVAQSSKVLILAYNSSTADATTQVQVYKNGVGQGIFFLTGVSGAINIGILGTTCVAGDLIALKQEAGTNMGLTNCSLHLIIN
jgi:hypothetical protein